MIWLLGSALAEPLALESLLERVDQRVPELAAAEFELDAARAKERGARGAFDPVFSGAATVYDGKDPRQFWNFGVGGKTAVGVGWDVRLQEGSGNFPAYAGEDETKSGTELAADLKIPLLEGLVVSDALVDRNLASISAQAKALAYASKRLDARQKARMAYWKWAASGGKLAVDRALLVLAESRRDALKREVTEGARARIDLVDNERVVAERRGAVLSSRAELAAQAQKLSLYNRDGDGRPVVPTEDDLPEMEGTIDIGDLSEDLAKVFASPDVQVWTLWTNAADTRLRGARNDVLPRLDAKAGVEYALAGETTEAKVGAELEVPMLMRKERGAVQKARAEVSARQQDLRGARDRGEAELRAVRARLAFTTERVDATSQARTAAEEVVRLEGRRFQAGGSALFTLLQREEKLAKARKDVLDAQLALRFAEADYLRVIAAE